MANVSVLRTTDGVQFTDAELTKAQKPTDLYGVAHYGAGTAGRWTVTASPRYLKHVTLILPGTLNQTWSIKLVVGGQTIDVASGTDETTVVHEVAAADAPLMLPGDYVLIETTNAATACEARLWMPRINA